MVVYGHTVVQEAQWINNTIDIDTGCVFGGKLTALRYPERQIVSVPAKKPYKVSKKLQDMVGIQCKRNAHVHVLGGGT